ncbi:hypothetical protein [Amycolatopsis pretoriensis]|uniref:hypothetical protein n=1 Tax=Amycolatopsis pretoriensis TaxID=218821 RepID=UPI001ABF414F|nr:hypothetical protein [Amycolatopsis pretoriensis]
MTDRFGVRRCGFDHAMRKIIIAGLALVSAAVGAATPAQAATTESSTSTDSGLIVGVTSTVMDFTAVAVCLAEVAVVPALSDWTGNHVHNCSNGNVLP